MMTSQPQRSAAVEVKGETEECCKQQVWVSNPDLAFKNLGQMSAQVQINRITGPKKKTNAIQTLSKVKQ